MKKNCNKIKHTCGSIVFAGCTSYEADLPEFSELECPSIEETTEELYNLVGEIKGETDLKDLGERCLEYVETEEGKIIVKNVLLKHEDEICLLKNRVKQLEDRQLCDFSISCCGIDLKCLSLPCDTSIPNLGQLLEAMITKICQNNE